MLYHLMDQKSEKRDRRINAFKATESWYDAVKKVATRRHLTIAGGIIYLVELGLPVEQRMTGVEASLIQTVAAEIEEHYRLIHEKSPTKKRA